MANESNSTDADFSYPWTFYWTTLFKIIKSTIFRSRAAPIVYYKCFDILKYLPSLAIHTETCMQKHILNSFNNLLENHFIHKELSHYDIILSPQEPTIRKDYVCLG